MSNESWPSSGSPVPPPPPGAPTPPPPPPFGSAPPPPGAPPAPGYPTPPAWNAAASKPPRPAVPLGAGLMIAGAVLLVVGSVLTWFTFGDLDVNGFTELPNASDEEQVRDGPVFVFFAVVLAAFGIATLAARRNLAVAILAVITGALAVLAALVDLTDVLDLEDDPFLGDAIDVGPGLPVVMLGALVGLAGSIVVLAKRRR